MVGFRFVLSALTVACLMVSAPLALAQPAWKAAGEVRGGGNKSADDDGSPEQGSELTEDEALRSSGPGRGNGRNRQQESTAESNTEVDDHPVAESPESESESTAETPPEVIPEPSREVLLSWTIPVERENGDPLSMADLAGYELVYLAEEGGAEAVVVIDDPQTVSITVVLQIPATYHFAIAAIDSSGLRSDLSSVVSFRWTTSP